MKALYTLITILLVTGSTLLMAKEQAEIKVTINNIENIEGNIMAALYNSKDSYNSDSKKGVRYQMKKVDRNTVIITFKDLTPGIYAIKLYQDENKNGKLDKILVIPSEPYGFSNNPDTMGVPEFNVAAFKVTTGSNAVNIVLK